MVKYILRGLILVLGLSLAPSHADSFWSGLTNKVNFGQCTKYNRGTCVVKHTFLAAVKDANCSNDIKNCSASFCVNNCNATTCSKMIDRDGSTAALCKQYCKPYMDISGAVWVDPKNPQSAVQLPNVATAKATFKKNLGECFHPPVPDQGGAPTPLTTSKDVSSGDYIVNEIDVNDIAQQLLFEMKTLADAPLPDVVQATLTPDENRAFLTKYLLPNIGTIAKNLGINMQGLDAAGAVGFMTSNMAKLVLDNDFVAAARNVVYLYQLVGMYYYPLGSLMANYAKQDPSIDLASIQQGNKAAFDLKKNAAAAVIQKFFDYVVKASTNTALIGNYKGAGQAQNAQVDNSATFGGFDFNAPAPVAPAVPLTVPAVQQSPAIQQGQY